MSYQSEHQDGGWGWVVVVSSFLIMMLSCGTIFSIGVIFDDLMVEFNSTKAEVSIISSISFSLMCFLGPVVSILQQKFGIRKVVCCGSFIVAIAVISSAFAPNLMWIYLTLGVLGGCGLAMIYLPLLIVISFYFNERRSMATALACIGIQMGAFLYPYLLRFLVSVYTLRGALFIIGGIATNSFAIAMLLRPVGSTRLKKAESKDKQLSVGLQNEKALDIVTLDIITEHHYLPPEEKDNDHLVNESSELREKEIIAQRHLKALSGEIPRNILAGQGRRASGSIASVSKSRGFIKPTFFARQLSEKLDTKDGNNSPMIQKRQASVPSLNKNRLLSARLRSGHTTGPTTPVLRKCRHVHSNSKAALSSSHYFDFNSALGSSFLSIPIYAASLAPDTLFPGHSEDNNQSMESIDKMPSDADESQSISAFSDKNDDTQSPQPKIAVLLNDEKNSNNQFHPALSSLESKIQNLMSSLKPFYCHFKSPRFTAFVISNFLICLVFYTPTVFIAHWCFQMGYPKEETTFMLSLIGLGNIVGRPMLALYADKLATYRLVLFAVMTAISGGVTCITPLFPNYYFMAFFAFQFGFFAGTSQILLTPILADIVPLSELSHAFAVLILVDGISLLIGPPVLALLPSYSLTFAVSGFILVSSAVVVVGPGTKVPCSLKRRRAKNDNFQNSNGI